MNVWPCKANTLADQITIKTMQIYNIINLFMYASGYVYICIYIYK